MGDSHERLAQLIDDPARFLDDPDPALRRLAASAAARHVSDGAVVPSLIAHLRADDDARVRAECAEVLGNVAAARRQEVGAALLAATSDPEAIVVEAVATALGSVAPGEAATAWLMDAAARHADKLVREAAVAALGEIGDPRAVDLLLDLVVQAPPQVRRRAVVALTVFDDERIEPAIRAAARDRNPMVREAAEMIVGPHRT